MGIESDKLVFDYLSRVGDLAHSTSMTAAERAELVGRLRSEIDRQRTAAGGAESKAAVRKILNRLGRPDDIVAGAGGTQGQAQGGRGGRGGRGGGTYDATESDTYDADRADRGGTHDGGGAGAGTGGVTYDDDQGGTSNPGSADTGGTYDPHAGSRFRTATGSGGGGSHTSSVPVQRGGSGARGEQAEPGGKPNLWKRATRSRAVSGFRGADGKADADVRATPETGAGESTGAGPAIEPTAITGPTAGHGSSAPHLAGMDELGPMESDPDWWRRELGSYGEGAGGGGTFGEPLPGFVGGIELPEILKPPPVQAGQAGQAAGQKGGPAHATVPNPRAAEAGGDGEADAAGTASGSRWRRVLRGRAGGGTGQRRGGVVELGAALLLVAGALVGSLIPLAVGWLAAWWSPRLSRIEAKWAALGMPGVVAAGTAVWIWGRMDGRWGPPIGKGAEALQAALGDSWPVLLRVAAVASALFLVWRARRGARSGP